MFPGLRDQGWEGVRGRRGRRPLRSSRKDSALVARDRRRRGLGGPSNSGVISTESGAGLTRVVISVSEELGLKLQETTQQVVKEMCMLLHMSRPLCTLTTSRSQGALSRPCVWSQHKILW